VPDVMAGVLLSSFVISAAFSLGGQCIVTCVLALGFCWLRGQLPLLSYWIISGDLLNLVASGLAAENPLE
jgi:hypothetical protein